MNERVRQVVDPTRPIILSAKEPPVRINVGTRSDEGIARISSYVLFDVLPTDIQVDILLALNLANALATP